MNIDQDPLNPHPNHLNNSNDIDSFSLVRDGLIEILQKTSVSQLKFSSKAVVLDYKLHPKAAIETLLTYKIRAAPVIENGKFVGVLDLKDTVKYALQTYSNNYYKHNDDNIINIDNKSDAKQYIMNNNCIASKTLTELSKHRPFKYVQKNDNLYKVAQLFAAGYHVIGVLNANNSELIGIITQGYFFRQIAQRWPWSKNGYCLLSELASLKYITSPIKSIHSATRAYDAFRVMVDSDLSGLAVVNDNGIIIHNTSATDIKLWLLSQHMLENTIERFLISVRNLSLTDRYPVSTCNLTDTFKRAVHMLCATKYHRVWIVNNQRIPIGVLAVTDIFQFICKTKE